MNNIRIIIVAVFCMLSAKINSNAQTKEWITFYEKSGFKETPRYAETIEYSKKLAQYSKIISYSTFGVSPQGRDLPLLIADKSGLTEIGKIKNSGKAVILIQACIHAGESDGKDAGLMLLRDMAIDNKYEELLENVSILFVPIFNVDGHERFGHYNRINQNGPEEMGWRATAQRLNLNRDYLKADAPEMQAMIRLYQKSLPDFYIDCHVTDGADYIYPLTYGLQMQGNLNKTQTNWLRDDYLPFVEKEMNISGNPIAPYMDFVQWNNPKSGIKAYLEGPRFSGGYAAFNNRPALLIEAHMLKDYKTRVTATYFMLLNSIRYISENSEELVQINRNADKIASDLYNRGAQCVLNYKVDKNPGKFKYKGFEYSVEKSDLSGGLWYKYGDNPVEYEIDYFERVPDQSVNLPYGYIIPVELKEVIEKLSLHNVHMETLLHDEVIKIEAYRFRDVTWNSRPFEGRLMLNFEIDSELRDVYFPKGSKIVLLNQRASQLAIHMLEPQAPDSFVRWGFFNEIFEQKEFAESYVMEKMAREMLAENPELKEDFEQKMNDDTDFASSSYAILNWFYMKSPYWDKNMNLYPIGRIMNGQSIKGLF